MNKLTTLVILAVCSTLPAQAASYTYINQKAPYKNRSPAMLTALNLPKVGTTFKVRVPAWWKSLSNGGAGFYSLAFGVRNAEDSCCRADSGEVTLRHVGGCCSPMAARIG
jgi:hypothetical protein